jgi:hypothetical protein
MPMRLTMDNYFALSKGQDFFKELRYYYSLKFFMLINFESGQHERADNFLSQVSPDGKGVLKSHGEEL